ncbi:MAG: PqqD family protein [Cyanobacteria bacterium P01_D01_bin.156]
MENSYAASQNLSSNWLSASIKACSGQISSELGDESVILHLDSGVYYGLTGVGIRIWELVQDTIVVSDIRETILHEYDVAPEILDRDLQKILTDLDAVNLIEVNYGVCA